MEKKKRNRVPTGRTAAQAWLALEREPQLQRDNAELKAALRLAHEQRVKLEQQLAEMDLSLTLATQKQDFYARQLAADRSTTASRIMRALRLI